MINITFDKDFDIVDIKCPNSNGILEGLWGFWNNND